MNSIQFRILGAFILVSLIPLSGLSLYMFTSLERQLILKEKELMTEIVSRTSKQMDQWLEKQMDMLQLLAKTKEVRSENVEDMHEIMMEFKENSSVFETAFYVKPNGYVHVHTTKSIIGSNYGDRRYIQKALQGEANFSDVLVSKATGNSIVVIATPVQRDGNIIGVLASSVNFNAFISEFANTDNEIGTMYLIDNQNIIRMSSDQKEFIGKYINETNLPHPIQQALMKRTENANAFNVKTQTINDFIFYSPVMQTGFGIYWDVPKSEIISIFKSIKLKMFMSVLLTSIFIIISAIFLSKGITSPLQAMIERMKAIAHGDGDLTKRVDIHSAEEMNQLRDHINEFINNIHRIVSKTFNVLIKMDKTMKNVQSVVQDSKKHTFEIKNSIQQVNQDFSIQADNTQNASIAVEQIAVGIHRISENTGRVSNYSVETNSEAKAGNDTIVQAMKQMQFVFKQVKESSEKMELLRQKSNEIHKIVTVITDISEQTNLLAINAAIEAARAGEQGRGFAVVAEEVRKLADQSKQSADDIIHRIVGVQGDIEQSVSSMEIVSKETKNGLELVEEAGRVFSNIVKRMQNMTNDIQEVSRATEEISAGTQEASASIQSVSMTAEHIKEKSNDMKESIEKEAEMMKQLSNSMQSLKEIETELATIVQRFKI